MSEVSKAVNHELIRRETELPAAEFSAVIGIICLALQIFVQAGL